jgi:hypothetical protein
MIGGILAAVIADALKAEFPDVYVGEPQDNERVTSPAIVLQLRSDSVVGSPLGRGQLTVIAVSQADDTTPAAHIEFVAAVDTFMRTISISSAVVQLAGIVAVSDDSAHAERHWQTPLQYIVGFSPV